MKIVVFGAPDHEEKLAREMCKAANVKTGTARKSGVPCHAGNAYAADDFRYDEEVSYDAEVEIIRFECSLAGVDTPAECDHHRPGDFGYSMGPDEFWEASSLGQLAKLLGHPKPADVDALLNLKPGTAALTAANDHCPAQAYQGHCPGITREQFSDFRNNLLSSQFGLSADEVSGEVAGWAYSMSIASRMVFGDGIVIDLRYVGPIKDRAVKSLIAEAGLKFGYGYLYLSINGGGKEEVCLGGNNSVSTVEAVMAWMSDICGNRKPYGVPVRGYAGIELNP